MRRLIYLSLLVMFVSVSATCVNASTDCERWFAAYRLELAHTRSVQRIAAAKRRAKLYAQRKLSGYVAPKPKPKVVLASAPRRTRRQTLHHFDLACGVLPEDEADGPLIAEEAPVPFHSARPLNDGDDVVPPGFGPMIAQNDTPPPPSNDGPSGPPVYGPPFGGGAVPPGGGPGIGTTSAPPGNPPGNPIPPVTPLPPPPDAPVPEPATFVMLLTGMAGAAGALRNRFKA